jgi:hypothetical protein
MVCAFTGNREMDEGDTFDIAAERDVKPLGSTSCRSGGRRRNPSERRA